MGTTSTLLFERPRDVLNSNFDDWPFLSVHFWGEKAEGRWILQIINAGSRHVNSPGKLNKIRRKKVSSAFPFTLFISPRVSPFYFISYFANILVYPFRLTLMVDTVYNTVALVNVTRIWKKTWCNLYAC